MNIGSYVGVHYNQSHLYSNLRIIRCRNCKSDFNVQKKGNEDSNDDGDTSSCRLIEVKGCLKIQLGKGQKLSAIVIIFPAS